MTDKIRFSCPSCNQQLSSPIKDAGKRAHCRRCGHKMLIPAADPPVDRGESTPEQVLFDVPLDAPRTGTVTAPPPPSPLPLSPEGRGEGVRVWTPVRPLPDSLSDPPSKNLAYWRWVAAGALASLLLMAGITVLMIATSRPRSKTKEQPDKQVQKPPAEDPSPKPPVKDTSDVAPALPAKPVDPPVKPKTPPNAERPAPVAEPPKEPAKPITPPAKEPAKPAVPPPKEPQPPAVVERREPPGEIRSFKGHTKTITALAILADGRKALTGSRDNTVRLWDLDSGKEVRRWDLEERALAFSADGRLAVSCFGGVVMQLWNLEEGKRSHRFFESKYISCAAFAPDARQVLSGAASGDVRLWDVASGKVVRVFKGHKGVILSLAFSPDGQRVLSSSVDGTVRVWDVNSGREVGRLGGALWLVYGLAFSADSRRALTGSSEKRVGLWSLPFGDNLGNFEGHSTRVRCVAFAPEGRRALSGAEDGTLRLWDLSGGKELHRFSAQVQVVRCVAFTPDGKRAVSGGEDGTVRLWSLPAQTQVAARPPLPPGGRGEGAKPRTRWMPVNAGGLTAVVILIKDDGIITTGGFPGKIAMTAPLDPRTGRFGNVTYEFDRPGSFWFMAEGGSRGVRHRGTELQEGKIYRFNNKKQPVLTGDGDFSVWITFAANKDLYPTRAAAGKPLARIPVRQRVQLLFASKTGSKGWHRVRTEEGVEGWVLGTDWKDTLFMRRGD